MTAYDILGVAVCCANCGDESKRELLCRCMMSYCCITCKNKHADAHGQVCATAFECGVGVTNIIWKISDHIAFALQCEHVNLLVANYLQHMALGGMVYSENVVLQRKFKAALKPFASDIAAAVALYHRCRTLQQGASN